MEIKEWREKHEGTRDFVVYTAKKWEVYVHTCI